MERHFKKCITYKVSMKLRSVMSTLTNLCKDDTPKLEMMNFDKNSPLNILLGITLHFDAEIISH